jgi:hypothetical protein
MSKAGASRPRRRAPVTFNPAFKALLWINAALCVVSLAVMVLATWDTTDPMPKGRERLYNACEHVFTLTAGAFIGLLGGRAAAPDRAPPEG